MLTENQKVYREVLGRLRWYRRQSKELKQLLVSENAAKLSVRKGMLFGMHEQLFSSLIELITRLTTPIRLRVTRNGRIQNDDFEERLRKIRNLLDALADVSLTEPNSERELAEAMGKVVTATEELLRLLRELRRHHRASRKSDSYIRIRLCSDGILTPEPSHYFAVLLAPLFF